MNSSSGSVQNLTADITYAVTNGVSVLVCLLAAILVIGLGLHTKVVYRLSLYQVLASFALATVETLQIVFINYNKYPEHYVKACTAVGWFALYCRWMKLLFTMWVTFHIFCFAVLHKNLKKLEILYVVTSLLIPAAMAVVPVITSTYGLSILNTCFMFSKNDSNHNALIERLALWDGSAMFILLGASAAMIAMIIKVGWMFLRNNMHDPNSDRDQFGKALKQLLPLAAFPILFFVFIVPVLVFDIYVTRSSTIGPNDPLPLSALICISLWSMSSGVTLIVHISVTRLYGRKQRFKDQYYSANIVTVQESAPSTWFSISVEELLS